MGNVSREICALKNNQKKILESKNTEMKNIFDALISTLTGEWSMGNKIREFEDRSIETSQAEMQTKKTKK